MVRWFDLYTYLLFPENGNFFNYLKNHSHSFSVWAYFFIPSGCLTLLLFCHAYLITETGILKLFLLSSTTAWMTESQVNALHRNHNSPDSETGVFPAQNQSCFCLRRWEGIWEVIIRDTSFLSFNKGNYFSFKYCGHIFMLRFIQRDICKICKIQKAFHFLLDYSKMLD